MTYEELEARIAVWAQTQPVVRVVLTIGSRARGNPDRWSDLDLLIFTTDPDRYADDREWLNEFGETLIAYLEITSAGDPEWFVLYEGGIKLDAVLMRVEDASLDLDALVKPFAHWDALRRGVNVLFDRLGQPHYLPPQPFTPPAPPTETIFMELVNGVLVDGVTTAKFIARGDFWRAQRWLFMFQRAKLLTLIEWHTHAVEPERDTWYVGRFIEEWADPRALAVLPQTFALYERESLMNALRALLDLFRLLGEETAERFGFSYPTEVHEKVVALVAAAVAQ